MLSCVSNTEGVKSLVKCVNGRSVVECRFPQSSDIAEIMAVEPQLCTVLCEVAEGRVNYGGKLVLTIVYSDEEGKLCRMQKGVEFSHYCDDDCLTSSYSGVCALKCDKLTVRREGSSFVVAAIVGASVSVYQTGERVYISSAEGAFVKCEDRQLCSLVTFNGESEVEDEFEADSLIDVLIPSAKAVVLSCECGVGEVTVSGELYLSILAMRKQSPVCIERTVPFKAVVPCDEASVGVCAFACVQINDLTVNATVNEDRGRCNLSLSCTLCVNGWFTTSHSQSVCVDAFSSDCRLTIKNTVENIASCVGIKVYTESVNGLASVKNKLGYDCNFCAATLPCVECEYNAEDKSAEGVVNCYLIYEQGEELKSTEVSLPFSVPLRGVAEGAQTVVLDVAVSGVSVRLKAEGEAEASANLKISATVCEDRRCDYISQIEEGDKLAQNESAVSVFLPKAGYELWDIAKMLNQSPEAVAKCNPQLTFPLSGRERILIYRGKCV